MPNTPTKPCCYLFNDMRLRKYLPFCLKIKTIATVAMEMKYLHVGIANWPEIPFVLSNHL